MITKNVIDNIAVASISDNIKLNVLNADDVKKELTGLLRDYNHLILDLKDIVFIDSTGFGALVTIFKRARENEKVFKLCNIEKSAMDLIKITKLDNVFDIYESLDGCVASFKSK